MAAVVGHHDHLAGSGLELVLQNHKVFIAEADDGMHFAALLVQLLGHGQRDGAAHAAADHGDLFEAIGVRRNAQRANEIMQALTLFKGIQLHRRAADDLVDNRDRAALAVIIRDGQRNALAVLQRTQDDELAGFCLLGDKRRIDHHLGDGRVQALFFDDFEHDASS